MFAKTRRRLERIEAALEEAKNTLAGISDALSLKTPGGLSVVAANAADAKTAAESAFVGMQTLASQATAKPGLPEVVKAVTAQTDAVRSMTAAVRTVTGPQPVLKDPAPAPDPGPAPALRAAAAKATGMGARVAPKEKM